MYDVLFLGTYYTDKNGESMTDSSIPMIELSYSEKEVFEEHGKFLDNVPDEYKKNVAHNILVIIWDFNLKSKFNSLHDSREEWGLEKKKKLKNEVGNKVLVDLKKVKNFRETLQSFDEKYKYAQLEQIERISEMERRVKNEIPQIWKNSVDTGFADHIRASQEVLEKYG